MRHPLELDGWDLLLFAATLPVTLATMLILPLEVRLWSGTRTSFFVSPIAAIVIRHHFWPPAARERAEVGAVRRMAGLVVLGIGGFVILLGGVSLWAALDLRDGPGLAIGCAALLAGGAVAFGGFRLTGG